MTDAHAASNQQACHEYRYKVWWDEKAGLPGTGSFRIASPWPVRPSLHGNSVLRFFKEVDDLMKLPGVIGDSCCDGRGRAEGRVDAAEVVVHEVERHGGGQVLQLLREAVTHSQAVWTADGGFGAGTLKRASGDGDGCYEPPPPIHRPTPVSVCASRVAAPMKSGLRPDSSERNVVVGCRGREVKVSGGHERRSACRLAFGRSQLVAALPWAMGSRTAAEGAIVIAGSQPTLRELRHPSGLDLEGSPASSSVHRHGANGGLSYGPAALTRLSPASRSSPPGSFAPLFRRHLRSASLATLQATPASERHGSGILPCVGIDRLDLAGRLSHYARGKLVHVDWSFRLFARALRHTNDGSARAGDITTAASILTNKLTHYRLPGKGGWKWIAQCDGEEIWHGEGFGRMPEKFNRPLDAFRGYTPEYMAAMDAAYSESTRERAISNALECIAKHEKKIADEAAVEATGWVNV